MYTRADIQLGTKSRSTFGPNKSFWRTNVAQSLGPLLSKEAEDEESSIPE